MNLHHEIQFMDMVFGVRITESVVPLLFVSLTNELLAIYLGMVCIMHAKSLRIGTGNAHYVWTATSERRKAMTTTTTITTR